MEIVFIDSINMTKFKACFDTTLDERLSTMVSISSHGFAIGIPKRPQFDESYTYDSLKYETYSLSLPGNFAAKFHRC